VPDVLRQTLLPNAAPLATLLAGHQTIQYRAPDAVDDTVE
jgi:hypothetical protein